MSTTASAPRPTPIPSLELAASRITAAKPYLVAAILAWFVLETSPAWLPTPDSALYLMLGRALARGDGYTLFGKPHAYVPPGYPLFLAALEQVGLGSMLCLNSAMAVIGALSVWMSYKLLVELASKPVAALVAALIGGSSLLHAMSALQLSDMPFTLLVLTALFCFLRGLKGGSWALELGTIALLFSCWVRVAGLFLVVPCALGLLLERRSASWFRVGLNSAALLVGALATVAVFYLQYERSLRAQDSLPPASYLPGIQALMARPAQFFLERPLRNAWESIAEFPRSFTGLPAAIASVLVVFTIPLLVGLWKRIARREWLLATMIAGYIGGILVGLPLGARYLLPVAPVLLLYFLEGLSVILDGTRRVRRWAPQILVLVVVGLLGINASKGVYSLYKDHTEVAARRIELVDSANRLHALAQSGEQFLSCDSEWQLAYLSDIPYLQLDRGALVRLVPHDQYSRFLFDRGVRLIVTGSEQESSTPDGSLVRSAVRDRQTFELVASAGRYQIYRFRSAPAVATAQAQNPVIQRRIP